MTGEQPVLGRVLKTLANMSGPLLFSGANFTSALLLQQFTDVSSFGLYAFVQIVIATGLGLSNGLFGSPLVAALSGDISKDIIGSFTRANFFFCLMAGLVVFGIFAVTTGSLFTGGIIAILAVLMWARWFLRSLELAQKRRAGAILSDITFGGVQIGAVLGLLLFFEIDFHHVIIVQIFSGITALVPFRVILGAIYRQGRKTSLARFFQSFGEHGRWSVIGVVTTDIVANSHAYILTLLIGPGVFAPIAAATLFFRPTGMVLTTITQFERPHFAEHIQKRRSDLLQSSVSFFKAIALAVWFANVALIFGLLTLYPDVLARGRYDIFELKIAAGLMAAVVLLRAFRGPESAALQAAGWFLQLAGVTLIGAPITLSTVIAMLFLLPDFIVLTLVGVLIGEVATLVLVRRNYGQFIGSGMEK